MMNSASRTPQLPTPDSTAHKIGDSPRKKTETDQRHPLRAERPQDFSVENTDPSQSSPSGSNFSSRPNTLSWQQRPPRSSTSPSHSPQPHVGPDTKLGGRAQTDINSASPTQESATRSDIAQSLSSKDPTWFRQTQDRGLGSAALRKNQEDDRPSVSSRGPGVGLPGMSREGASDAHKKASSESTRSISPATVSSAGTLPTSESASATSTFQSSKASTSPVSLSSGQRFHPPSEGSSRIGEVNPPETRNYAMSPFQKGLSSDRVDRPPSPTKGLGGFVQSAMMKRSDSVSKRWSTQTPGLSRGNSISTNRGAFEAPKLPFNGFASLGEPKPARFSREATPASTSSRPGSSHSNVTLTPNRSERDNSEVSTSFNSYTSNPPDSDSKELSESPRRPSSKDSNTEGMMSPPASPSKRWSPQKSTWLENAINKPESPKVHSAAQAAPQQPSWMSDIARAKQHRGSVDLPKGTAHKEIATGGLMRAPPPATGYKLPNIKGVAPASSVLTSRPKSGSSGDIHKTETSPKQPTTSITTSKSLHSLGSTTSPPPTTFEEPSLDSPMSDRKEDFPPSNAKPTPKSPPIASKSPPMKPKPETPPKKDFVSTLRSRQDSGNSKPKDEPEFKNVFGKLKPTQTQNFKAPDVLKDNIMRGKAGLSVTGGPKKTELKDEFKESILKKKAGMVAPSASVKLTSATSKNPDTSLPEALRKRQGLMKSVDTSGVGKPVQQPESKTQTFNEPTNVGLTHSKKAPSQDSSPTKPSTNGLGINFASSLSGILQRGPPQTSQVVKSSTSAEDTESPTKTTAEAFQKDPASPTPQLNHATKSRARGPKRKPPTASQQSSPNIDTATVAPSPKEPDASSLKVTKLKLQDQQDDKISKEPFTRPLQNITNSNNNNRSPSQPMSPRKPSTSVTQSPKPSPDVTKRRTADVTSNAGRTSPSKSSIFPSDPQLYGPKPPRKETPSASTGKENLIQAQALDEASKTAYSPQGPRSPPLPKKPTSLASSISAQAYDHSTAKPVNTPSTSHLSVSQLLSNLFDQSPSSKQSIKLDTQSILDSASSKESYPKIKTLRKQILEIVDNGKTAPVPSHQEHILFEDSLYICSHVFGTPAGQRMTEVYLWCGDGAPPGLLEDSQLFAKKFAKDNGGRLIVLQQGKETSSFFQALGGIVIVRRGSARPNFASDPFVLCGRQHLGQIAFDEGDFTPQGLCSGFPSIVAPGSGKLYLWKGKGASADEIGCARLIGMDLGATGEIEEVDEGQEFKAFWSCFGGPPAQSIADGSLQQWHHKASRESYTTRLFDIDADSPRPKSASSFMQWGRRGSAPSPDPNASISAHVKEITPFSQRDLSDEGIQVLDAFFDVYVYVPISLPLPSLPFTSCKFITDNETPTASTPSNPSPHPLTGAPPTPHPSVPPSCLRRNTPSSPLRLKIDRSSRLPKLCFCQRRGMRRVELLCRRA